MEWHHSCNILHGLAPIWRFSHLRNVSQSNKEMSVIGNLNKDVSRRICSDKYICNLWKEHEIWLVAYEVKTACKLVINYIVHK